MYKELVFSKGKIKNLTIGKSYKVVKTSNGYHKNSGIKYSGVWIIDDLEVVKYYSSKRFVSISEWREIRLNQLLK